jgi:putative phage-type endonuclease
MTSPTRTAPPYRIVLPASADRDLWLAERRKGIGSSDVAAVMGVSTFASAQHVYYDKRGELPLDDADQSEPARWGTLLEETVAREWARRNRSVVRRVGLIARKDAPHHRCTLDRRCDECPMNRDEHERCAVEVKCRSAYKAGSWKRNVPDDVLAQVLWQIHVTGYDHAHVATLIGGNDFRQYVVRRSDHEQLIADVVAVVDRSWDDIQDGRVPALTGEEPVDPMLDLLDQLHPNRTGVVDLDAFPALTGTAVDQLEQYETARLEGKAAKARQDAAKVGMLAALGGAQAAVLDGDLAYELRPTEGREKCDFAKLAAEFPDAYETCVTRNPGATLWIARQHRLQEIPS